MTRNTIYSFAGTEKYTSLFSKVDTERERFLEFERWWNGFYFMSREEIVAIIENLFIGNKLEKGEFRICDGCVADLRRELLGHADVGPELVERRRGQRQRPLEVLDRVPSPVSFGRGPRLYSVV